MALVQCRDCKKLISKRAKACINCGAPLKSSNGTALVLGLMGILGLIGWSSFKAETPAAAARRTADALPGDACQMAQQFVQRTLKAPATAKFSSCFDRAETVLQQNQASPPRFVVTGFVDAENAFSASIREHYRVELEQVSADKGTWRLIDLKM